MFRAIASDDFPPFGKFEMKFPTVDDKGNELAEVHLLTGVNGTGKTRLLSLLAAMLGYGQSLQKRLKGSKQGLRVKATDVDFQRPQSSSVMVATAQSSGWQHAGSLAQWCGRVPAFAYHGNAYVSDANVTVMAGVAKPDRAKSLAFSRPEGHSQQLLQAITNLKVQAAMDVMNAQPSGSRAVELVRALEGTLTEVTGLPFLFHVINYPQPTLQVKWANADLNFDLLPDGLRSIIGWMVDAVVMMDAWLQGQGNVRDTEAVFLLDEIESHLHPLWQRRILPAFQRLFPKAQIFVATHSPFVISSLNHGWIHRLNLEKDGKVNVAKPVAASPGDSYIYVVEEIMGLPEWYDPETEKILADFRAARDRAFAGDDAALTSAFELGQNLAERSDELRYVMGKELSQMERRLGKAVAR